MVREEAASLFPHSQTMGPACRHSAPPRGLKLTVIVFLSPAINSDSQDLVCGLIGGLI